MYQNGTFFSAGRRIRATAQTLQGLGYTIHTQAAAVPGSALRARRARWLSVPPSGPARRLRREERREEKRRGRGRAEQPSRASSAWARTPLSARPGSPAFPAAPDSPPAPARCRHWGALPALRGEEPAGLRAGRAGRWWGYPCLGDSWLSQARFGTTRVGAQRRRSRWVPAVPGTRAGQRRRRGRTKRRGGGWGGPGCGSPGPCGRPHLPRRKSAAGSRRGAALWPGRSPGCPWGSRPAGPAVMGALSPGLARGASPAAAASPARGQSAGPQVLAVQKIEAASLFPFSLSLGRSCRNRGQKAEKKSEAL